MQQQFEAKKEECYILVKEVDSLGLRLAEEKHANEVDRKDVTISVSFVYLFICISYGISNIIGNTRY